MRVAQGPGRRSSGYDQRLRGRLGEFYGVDRKRPGIFVGERGIDARLESNLRYGAFERDADIVEFTAPTVLVAEPDITKPPERLAAVDTSAKVPL